MSKKLPPPKGAGATRESVLASRFDSADDTDDTDGAVTRDETPAEPARTAQAGTTAAAPAAGREPAGMTRRTYYYSTEVADALAAAITDISARMEGRVPKHEIIDALISAGIDRRDEVAAQLAHDLVTRLTPASYSPMSNL